MGGGLQGLEKRGPKGRIVTGGPEGLTKRGPKSRVVVAAIRILGIEQVCVFGNTSPQIGPKGPQSKA